MSYKTFKYEPKREIMDDLLIKSELIKTPQKVIVVNNSDKPIDIKLSRVVETAFNTETGESTYTGEASPWKVTSIKPTECDHEYNDEIAHKEYNCNKCNNRINDIMCNKCGYDDAIPVDNIQRCLKCPSYRYLGASDEWRAFQAIAAKIRTGLKVDLNDPAVQYVKRTIDLQDAYCKRNHDQVLTPWEQSSGVLEELVGPCKCDQIQANANKDLKERWAKYQSKIDDRVERFHYLQELQKHINKAPYSDLSKRILEYISELKEEEGEALGEIINSSY